VDCAAALQPFVFEILPAALWLCFDVNSTQFNAKAKAASEAPHSKSPVILHIVLIKCVQSIYLESMNRLHLSGSRRSQTIRPNTTDIDSQPIPTRASPDSDALSSIAPGTFFSKVNRVPRKLNHTCRPCLPVQVHSCFQPFKQAQLRLTRLTK
jgi:hypothetical protein